MMKKLPALLTALTLCLSLAACGGDTPSAASPGGSQPSSAASTGSDTPSAAPTPSAGAEEDRNDTGPAAPVDFSAVSSYTEIPVLADREPFEATPRDILRTSWWYFIGGSADGKEMDQTEVQDLLRSRYGGDLQLHFDGDTAVSMVQGNGSLDGSYEIQADNYTITMSFDDNGTTRSYVGVFTWPDQAIVVLVLVAEDEPSTALYFEMDEA